MKSDCVILDIELIEKCVKLLKPSKAAGHDGLVSEHIFNSHPSIFVYLKLLFTMMLTHCYVPNASGWELLYLLLTTEMLVPLIIIDP